jgi:hypothetical protein
VVSLKLEPDEVLQTVLQSHKESDNGADNELKWEESAECEDGENLRCKRADALNK